MRRPARNTMRSLLCCAALSLAFCSVGLAQLKPSNPTLISFSPTQGSVGSTITITLVGTNFVPRAMNLIFTPSQGITVSNLAVLSPTQISAQVQIDPTAQTGNRQVILVDADRNLPSRVPFVLTAPAAPPNCPPGITAAGCGAKAPPALRGFTPHEGAQGSSLTVTFAGANFVAPASLQFAPSSGITAGPATVINANEIQAHLTIAPNASLGARGVVLSIGNRKLPAPDTFAIVSGVVSRLPPMQILRVVPNQIAAGAQNVDITFEGVNFTPGTQVTFTVGAGVPAAVFAAGAARYVNSTELHVTVSALSSALPGGRDITLETPNQQTVTGKGLLNILRSTAANHGAPPKPKIMPIGLQRFPEGKILLEDPKWGAVADGADGAIENYGIPPLNDETVFEWKEQNPGTADYFELRIYAGDGKTLVGSKRIDGSTATVNGKPVNVVPTYYRADPAFLNQVLSRAAFANLPPLTFGQTPQGTNTKGKLVGIGFGTPLSLALQPGGSTQTQSNHPPALKPVKEAPANQANSGPQIPPSDLEWEVAGFRTFNKDGSARGSQNASNVTIRAGANGPPGNVPQPGSGTPQPQSDVEVEISDRWALSATAFPTGLSMCSLACEKGLQPFDLDTSGPLDPTRYIGDRIYIAGNFDLSRSPYATHPGAVQKPATCGGKPCFGNSNPVEEFQFNNVFVDWGDGTVERLSAKPYDPSTSQWNSNVELSVPPCDTGASSPPQASASSGHGLLPIRMKEALNCVYHSYNYEGGYTIRVFQLSDQDVQQVQASLVAASADGPAVSPFLSTAVLQHINLKGSTGAAANPSQSAINSLPSSGPSPSDVAARAYMIFCSSIEIKTVEDPLATGPLYLRGIANPDFGAHDMNGHGMVRVGGDFTPAGAIEGGGQGTRKLPVLTPQVPQAAAESTPKGKGFEPLRPSPPGGSSAAIAICSACDDSLQAQTAILYVGVGQVRVTWHVDGGTWPPQSNGETVPLGPSTPRTNLTRAQAEQEAQHPDPDKVTPTKSHPVTSKWLPLFMKPAPDHSVWVEAQVLPSPPPPNLSYTMSGAINKVVATSLGTGRGTGAGTASSGSGVKLAADQASQAAQSALSVLAAPPGSGLPPLKVGFLSPSNHATSGMGAVQYVNGPLTEVAKNLGSAAQQPGNYVSSKQTVYEVTAADPKQPCKFMFPVKDGGSFEVTGLQNKVTETNGKWTGSGVLKFNLASVNGYEEYASAIKIENWQVSGDGTVQQGTLDVSPALSLDADTPAMTGTIDRLQGAAGDVVNATLTVQLSDNSVQLPDGSVPKWPGVTAPLSSAGDWYGKGLTLPLSTLGYTGFTIQSSDVRLDLSLSDGDAPGAPCAGNSGAKWLGVRLAQAAITPFTFGLVGSSTGTRTMPNWGVDSNNSVCGTFDTLPGGFRAQVMEGSVAFQSIHMVAQHQSYEADYSGVDVQVPWLNADLKGNTQLLSGGGKATNMKLSLTGSAQPLAYASVTLKASNLQFTQVQGGPWAVNADTEWDLSAEKKPFAQLKTNMYFGMDGRAYFRQGSPTADVKLGGTSTLGQTPLELVSAHLTAPASGTDMLDFAVQTKLHLSEVMPATDVQVNYSVHQPQPTQYTASGPTNSPFMVDLPYPAGQSASEAKVHPSYNGGAANSGGGDAYSGTVDLSELGGPPVTGEFRLGYQGGHDYWLTRVTIGLGQEGVPLIAAPPVMNLYAIRGGLGHNFPLSAFSDGGPLTSEQPAMDNSYLFMAGLRVGMPDQFTYTLDGNLTIEASGPQQGARMDFKAWLLTGDQSGNGTFQGYFQYASNSFDGRLWGGMNFMGGLASFSLGNSASNAAVDLHFGGGSWHIYAGNKNGQRVQAHFVVANANSYLMLGSDVGLAVGGDANFCLCIGDDSVASAYIKGDLDIGVQITPQPHFIGDASADLAAGVCAFSACIDANVSAQVHLEALPLDMRATASLTLPIPFWNPTVTFTTHLQV